MANRERGESRLSVNGRDYTLKLTMNARCEIEDRLSTPEREVTFATIATRIKLGDQRAIRAFVWALLLYRHRKDFPTPESVGDLIDAAGGTEALLSAIREANERAQPDPADLQAINGTEARSARPPDARPDPTSTGPGSIAPPDAPA